MKGSEKFFELPEEARINLVSEFYDAINCLKNREEVRLFFRDLVSPQEIYMLARRIQVAILLKHGYTRERIREILGVSPDKINNVKKSIQRHGQGYKLVEKRLLKILQKRLRRKQKTPRPPGILALKQRYPGYFLLFNLIDALASLPPEEKIENIIHK